MKKKCICCKNLLVEAEGDMCLLCQAYDGELAQNFYALARMLASECWTAFKGTSAVVVRTYTAWCAINEAKRRRLQVHELLMPDGVPGKQKGRYAATTHDSKIVDRLIAWEVLHSTEDPTKGATNFDCPKAQADALARKEPGYKDTADDVKKSRIKDGMELVLVPGIPEYQWRLWRRKAKKK
jgi:hypothetical protein